MIWFIYRTMLVTESKVVNVDGFPNYGQTYFLSFLFQYR